MFKKKYFVSSLTAILAQYFSCLCLKKFYLNLKNLPKNLKKEKKIKSIEYFFIIFWENIIIFCFDFCKLNLRFVIMEHIFKLNTNFPKKI